MEVEDMKNGHVYIVDMHGEYEVVIVRSNNDVNHVFPCGDEQGWPASEVDRVIREVRIPARSSKN